MNKFKLGDRVTRLTNVYDPKSKLMHGEIIEVYSDYKSKFGPYPELYVVRWDDKTENRGYLPHGLDSELYVN